MRTILLTVLLCMASSTQAATEAERANYLKWALSDICRKDSGFTCTNRTDNAAVVVYDEPGSTPITVTASVATQMVEQYRAAALASTKSHAGDGQISKLKSMYDMVDWTETVCKQLGQVCLTASGLVSAFNPILGLTGIAACGGSMVACEKVATKSKDRIKELIKEIEDACAQGDTQCYEKIIKEKAPEELQNQDQASTSGDGQGNGGGSGPGVQGPPGPSSGDAEAHPPGGGSIPCTHCKITECDPKKVGGVGCDHPPKPRTP